MKNTTTTNTTTNNGMSTTKKILIASAVGLTGLYIIGSVITQEPTNQVTPEPAAVVETVVETQPEVEPEIDDAWINETAANMTWSNMAPVDRQAICDAHNSDAKLTEGMARDMWDAQGLEADLQDELILLMREGC